MLDAAQAEHGVGLEQAGVEREGGGGGVADEREVGGGPAVTQEREGGQGDEEVAERAASKDENFSHPKRRRRAVPRSG